MSSFRKAAKSGARSHKERHQPESRQHLGLLEKKKDYKLRAKNHHLKENKLKALQRKILNKNPDEFYFHMINSEMKDGYHYEKEKPDEYTEAQLKLMNTQDINYVNYKHSIEAKKIEKLKAQLHFLEVDGRPQNNHTFFVDTKSEAKKFDVVKHLDTHPSVMERSYNRPRVDNLKKLKIQGADHIESVSKQIRQQYQELSKRIEREQELNVVSQKLDIKKKLVSKNDAPLKKVKEGTKTAPPVYMWKKERKR